MTHVARSNTIQRANRIFKLAAGVAMAIGTAGHALTAAAQTTQAGQDKSAHVLTPAAPATPRINGPRVFGVRPGNPLLYAIPATGDRPMTFAATRLPEGVSVDANTGRITGAVAAAGEYKVTLRASNDKGSAEKEFTIVVGDRIALTPPMGWNTYYGFRLNINDALVRRQADAMISTGLANHGWTYINLDEGWANKPGASDPNIGGPVRDATGRVNPNRKFPDMKGLCDYLHDKGLKAGIYSSPGPLCCGGFVGSHGHEDDDARSYAEWGFDYVKYDWCFYAELAHAARAKEYATILPGSSDELKTLLTRKAEIEKKRPRTPETAAEMKEVDAKLDTLFAAMDKTKKREIDLATASAPYRQFAGSMKKLKRDMVFSFCQYGMDDVSEWGAEAGGNSWRTTRDIIDDWKRVSSIGFGQAGLEKFAGPGRWNDPDMLQVGVMVKNIPSRLTADEQYAHVSLWCLLSAPLLIGGDLTRLDAFTLNLLTNDEVINVNQDALGKQAARIKQDGSAEVWAKEMEDGSRSVGLFNRGESAQDVSISWKDLGVSGTQSVRDLWRQKDLGAHADRFAATIPSHGVLLIRVKATGSGG